MREFSVMGGAPGSSVSWIDRGTAAVFAVALAFMALSVPATAGKLAEQFAASLNAEEETLFVAYYRARSAFDQRTDAYWSSVDERRRGRKAKRGTGAAFTEEDYVPWLPPIYEGPELSAALAKRWAAFQEKEDVTREPPQPKPGLADFLAAAQQHYAYVPDRVTEREFKRRYAAEALKLGLSKDQVVRIYALETSGLGTADMVAGIHPITKKGSPISTAIGYSQLLAANSVSELAQSGNAFVERLRQLARAPGTSPERVAALNAKTESLKRMVQVARSVPDAWDRHMALARTPKGHGIHAINLDGDIGPWLQVIKLKGLKETAARNGRDRLTGAEIELMNLAGPMTGIEMMTALGRQMPTPNFFERQAYGRNTIVRGKTAGELLLALDERMETNLKNAGAIEFAAVFDEMTGVAAGTEARN